LKANSLREGKMKIKPLTNDLSLLTIIGQTNPEGMYGFYDQDNK
jgi:hypothetical protein